MRVHTVVDKDPVHTPSKTFLGLLCTTPPHPPNPGLSSGTFDQPRRGRPPGSKRKAPATPLSPEEEAARKAALEERRQRRKELEAQREEEVAQALAEMEAEDEEQERARKRARQRGRRRGSSEEEEEYEYDDDDSMYGGESELHCVCRQPDDGRPMIECENCNKWFHSDCVGTTPEVWVGWGDAVLVGWMVLIHV